MSLHAISPQTHAHPSATDRQADPTRDLLNKTPAFANTHPSGVSKPPAFHVEEATPETSVGCGTLAAISAPR